MADPNASDPTGAKPPRIPAGRPSAPPPLPRSVPPVIGARPPGSGMRPRPVSAVAARVRALGVRPPPLPPPILTPSELERFKNLLLFSRAMVEGYFVGKHRSPARGSSVEFADYKEYVPGDEVSRLDWRVYGRTRRLYVRQFEEETDMIVYLLVDVSASMNYQGERRQSKYILAAKIAAALAYLMIHQGDKAALGLFADKLLGWLPPGGTRRHLHELVSRLERVRPSAGTGIAQALFECDALCRKRGRLVLLSDFLTELPDLFEALGRFQHRRFEILLLHVVDPDELHLPSLNSVRFEDLETRERVDVEPEEIRGAYREAIRAHIDTLARQANERGISHSVVSTERPYLDALEAYLGFRGQNPFSS